MLPGVEQARWGSSSPYCKSWYTAFHMESRVGSYKHTGHAGRCEPGRAGATREAGAAGGELFLVQSTERVEMMAGDRCAPYVWRRVCPAAAAVGANLVGPTAGEHR